MISNYHSSKKQNRLRGFLRLILRLAYLGVPGRKEILRKKDEEEEESWKRRKRRKRKSIAKDTGTNLKSSLGTKLEQLEQINNAGIGL